MHFPSPVLQVNVSVTDINDNPPSFEVSSVSVSVSEEAKGGTPIYVARAEDKDLGRNGEITYALTKWTGRHKHFEVSELRRGFSPCMLT